MRIGALICLLLLILWPAAPLHSSVPPTIRVGILREQERVVVMSDRPIEAVSGFMRLTLEPTAYEFVPSGTGIEAVGFARFDGVVRLLPTGDARLYVAVRPYRGVLELRRTPSGRLTVVNELDLEQYLYGVLKMEVDPRWPAEALKAQAVASRTLALQSLSRFQSEGYDVRATTDSQVYGGLSAEDPRTTAAVDATRGEIMTFQDRPIFSAYHSDSGGYTESSEYVWGGRYPYLKGVPDPYSLSSPTQDWVLRLDLPVLEDRLRRAGRPVNGITLIDVVETTPSGRAATVRIVNSLGVLLLKGIDLRTILGPELLRSTMFMVRIAPDEQAAVEFVGKGSGHGVGLSQWGARGQALLGRTYAEILRYYYSGITIETR